VPLKGFLEKLDEQKHCVEVESITVEYVKRIEENQKKWRDMLKEIDGKIKRMLKEL